MFVRIDSRSILASPQSETDVQVSDALIVASPCRKHQNNASQKSSGETVHAGMRSNHPNQELEGSFAVFSEVCSEALIVFYIHECVVVLMKFANFIVIIV
jgi:hypothetical protein